MIDESFPTVVETPPSSMDEFGNSYFELHKTIATFLGVWPTQTNKERILRYFVLGFMLFFFLLLQLCQVFTWGFNVQTFVFVFQLIISDVCCIVQYAATIIHISDLEKGLNIVVRDWQQLKNDDELKIMQKHAYQTIVCTIVCGFLFLLFMGSLTLPPILRKMQSASGDISNVDQFSIFFCLDHFIDSEMFYYPALIYQIILFLALALVALGCYSMYFSSIQHICSRLSIVKAQLHRPFIKDDHNHEIPMDLSHWMIDIIQHLASIREFVNLINTIGEKNYLFQMTLAFFLLVIDFLYLLQIPALLTNPGSRKDVPMFVIFIISNLLPIYVSSLIGQRLIDYSEDVYKEACLIPFHEISLKTQKLLLMTLMMYPKPYSLSIGKVFVSSHEFFSDILRTSLSFTMMLHSTQNL